MKMKISFPLINRPENLYLIIALIFGLLFLSTTPPFQVPDEIGHFYRSYQLSGGQLVASVKKEGKTSWIGANVPKSLILLVNATKDNPGRPLQPFLDLPLNDKDRAFSINICMSFYSPVPYLPQIAGIYVGRMLNLSPLKLMYIGRFSILITSILIVYLAIRITPVHKWLFVLMALTPTFLFLSASLSADTFTNTICALWFALVLRYSFRREMVGITDIALLVFISVLIALSKQAYIPLVLLIFLIRKEQFSSLRAYLFTVSLLLFLPLIASLSWSYTINDLVKVHFANYNWKFRLTPENKIIFITHEPLNYLGIIVNSFKSEWKTFSDHFIGIGSLGLNRSVYLPKWVNISYFCMIILIMLCSPEKNEISLRPKAKIIILFSVLSSIFLIYTSLYIMYSSMEDNHVGIHGRYFIPLGLPFIFLIYGTTQKIIIKRLNLLVIFTVIISLSSSILILIKKYSG